MLKFVIRRVFKNLVLAIKILLQAGSFVLMVYVGGVFAGRQMKTTRLPAASSALGRVITFETERTAVNKVRVTIEVAEKVITFDWILPGVDAAAVNMSMPGLGGAARLADTDPVSLFFFTRLSQPGVAVTVDSCLS